MNTGAAWGPRTEADALRQGRPSRPGFRVKLAAYFGLDGLMKRRARRRWVKLRPYIIAGTIGAVALIAAVIKAVA